MQLYRMIFSLSATLPLLPVAQAQPEAMNFSQLDISETNPIWFTPPTPPPATDRPRGRREGGASRGNDCNIEAGHLPLTALVPRTSENRDSDISEDLSINTYDSVLSLTTQPRPDLWFYVPYPLETTPLQFVLQDENNDTLYQTDLSGNATGKGIVQVSLSEATLPLQPDTRYRWFFMAYCSENDPMFVEGWLERTPLDMALSLELSQTSRRDQAAFYAQNGFWQDAITTLGQLYREDPNHPTVADDWHSLLTSVDLERLAQQPLVECCTPK